VLASAGWGRISERRSADMNGTAPTSDLREVIVQGSMAKLAQEIRIGPHRLVADEPTAVGGGDTGPTPYDLLLAALGA
jgi:putative redox protein